MKGLTLEQMAAELTRQNTAKRDFVANTKVCRVEADENSPSNLTLNIGEGENKEAFPVRKHAVRQVGSRLKIPAAYVDRLAASHPDLLAWNINTLFDREPEKRMLRTLDGECRAFLSDRYRPLDNFDLATAVLPTLQEQGAQVSSCEVAENRFYIKAIIPGQVREIAKPGTFMGDGGHNPIHFLKPGIVISNSEVGAGALWVKPGVHEVKCSNLAIFNRDAMRKYHSGKRTQGDEQTWRVLSDATKTQTDKAVWMQVNDLVRASLGGKLFEEYCQEIEAKMTGETIVSPVEAVKELPNTSEQEQGGILAQLITGGDLSQYGMQAAITSFCQKDEVPYERQVELEELGGNVIELPQSDWQRIAQAA